MTAFDHVLVLLSFVYALAITHLLSKVVALYFARERVTFYGLQALLAVIAILQVFFSWIELWPFRGTPSWDLVSIGIQFLYAVELYFLCSVALPDAKDGEVTDLAAYYQKERKTTYWLWVLVVLTAMAGNFTFLKNGDVTEFLRWQLVSLAGFIPIALALLSRSERAQWAAGIALLATMLTGNVVVIWSIG
jgi:NADH:ubiquinone oxidoreductase subunit 2 (subunit N)